MTLRFSAPCLVLTSITCSLFVAGVSAAGVLWVSAGSASVTQVLVSWTFSDDPQQLAGHPEWVGYDIYRRAAATCGDWVRVNPDPFPRLAGQTHGGSFLDSPPVLSSSYQYDVRPVDATRAPVAMGFPDCEPPCPPPAYAACPDLSAPLVVGTVTDLGWAVMLTPCATGCWGLFYVENPAAGRLRPYADSGQALRVYGLPFCGTVEGCGLALDRFEPGACGVTSLRGVSWGRLKSHYR